MAQSSRPKVPEPRGRRLVALALGLALLASMLSVAVPPAVHATITGTPALGTENSATAPSSFTAARNSLTVVAGTGLVTQLDGSPTTQPSLFTVAFGGVTFSGAQFYLYMSMNGNAQVSPTQGDIEYAGPFSAAQLANPTIQRVTSGGSTYGYGKDVTSNVGVVVGPVPTLINSSYQYVKVYDGSCGTPGSFPSCSGTGVAGALQLVSSLPGITVTPSSGAAGTALTLNGGGFVPGARVDIGAQYSTAPWVGGNSSKKLIWITGITANDGHFSVTEPMVDTMQVINPLSTGQFTTVPIVLSAVDASNTANVLNPAQESLSPPTFREFSRGIASVLSYDSSGKAVDVTDGAFAPNYLYGNDSGSTGVVGSITVRDFTPITTKSFGTLKIVGNFSYVGQPVTFWVETAPGTCEQMNTTAQVVPNSAGTWAATVEVPSLSAGAHTVFVVNDGVEYGITNSAGCTINTSTSTTTTSTTTVSTTTTTTSSNTATTTTTVSSSTASTTSVTSTSTATTSTGPTTTTSSGTTTSGSSTATSGIPAFPYDGAAVASLVLALVAGYLIARAKLNAPAKARPSPRAGPNRNQA